MMSTAPWINGDQTISNHQVALIRQAGLSSIAILNGYFQAIPWLLLVEQAEPSDDGCWFAVPTI
jgi:hypothetical protein